MAKFCTKCGAPLSPRSKFCQECGAPVEDNKNIKISQDDKGGLTFDAPEGTMVEISDPKPVKKAKKEKNEKKKEVENPPIKTTPAKEEKIKTEKKSKGGFGKFIIILLVALIAFTGFVKPGFFLKGGKPGGGGNPPQNTPGSGNSGTVDVELPEYNGNSKPFEKNVCEGVVVRAEKNAFAQDTDVKMTPLDEIPSQYNDILNELEDQWMLPISAWEVDAGLSADEVIPGVYEVEVDLNTLDIDPAFYPCLTVGRFGDDGSFQEYEATINDNKLIYHSRQNSVTAILVCGAIIVYRGAQAVDYINESLYFWSRKDYLKRYVEIKKYQTAYGSYELQWITSDIDPELGDKVNRIHEIEEDCRRQTEEYEKTIEDTKQLDRNKQKASYYKYLLESDEEYLRLKEQVKIPDAIQETKKYIDIAYNYLGKIANVRMPTGRVIFQARTDSNKPEYRDKLGLAEKVNFISIVSLWPLKALTSQENKDNYLLTITHELFHVCQERYRYRGPIIDKLTDDPRYDEMVTMVLERDAKRYYQNNDIITTDPPLTEKIRWDMLRLPIDKEPNSDGASNGKDVKMKEGYQLGDFIMYLQEEYSDRTVTPHQLMKARSSYEQPGVSEPVRTAFGITVDEFDLFFRKWLLARRGEIMSLAVQNFNEAAYYPQQWTKLAPGQSVHVSLINDGNYFLAMNGFMKGEKGDLKGLLVFDDNFRKNHPSINLIPLVPDYVPTPRGAYFNNITFLTMGEIYGKIESGENMGVGYTLWTFKKTSTPAVEQNDEAVLISLPGIDGMAKAGVIDGYILKVMTGDKVLVDKEIEKTDFEKRLSINKEQLLKDSESMDLRITICEFVRDNNGNRCLGIESDPAAISIGKKEETNDQVYTNLYLYKDMTCRFDGDTINYYIEKKESYNVGKWPGGSSVVIKGNKVEVTLAAVDMTITGSDLEYNVTNFNKNLSRPAVTFTGELVTDYGGVHLYYAMTGVSPATFTGKEVETGTQRDGTYSGGQTTYTYHDYRHENGVTFSDPEPDGIIDVYFKNNDISSVEIILPGKYTYNDYYYTEGRDPISESKEANLKYTIELLR